MEFNLVPFTPNNVVKTLTGSITWQRNEVHLRYALRADMEFIRWTTGDGVTGRKHGLWHNTCFELFVSTKKLTSYHELNLAPDGHWNCYGFTGLRTGMHESTQLVPVSAKSTSTPEGASLEVVLSVTPEFAMASNIGLSAIVEQTPTKLLYYGLRHGKHPDFHDPANHALQLNTIRG